MSGTWRNPSSCGPLRVSGRSLESQEASNAYVSHCGSEFQKRDKMPATMQMRCVGYARCSRQIKCTIVQERRPALLKGYEANRHHRLKQMIAAMITYRRKYSSVRELWNTFRKNSRRDAMRELAERRHNTERISKASPSEGLPPAPSAQDQAKAGQK